jgi:hypothetical protein
MRRTLAELDERWGGAAAYLVGAGARPGSIDRWRDLLITTD